MEILRTFLRCLLVIQIVRKSTASSSGYFTAAVYEHVRQEDRSPDTRVQTNLKWYHRATELANKQGADMIVFPEYGIFPPGERKVIKRHLEVIPNPREAKVNPCKEYELFSNRPILTSLSCLAKKNEIVVVANMGGKERCDGEPDCPIDGDVHLNANVAFDQNGTLIGRYYKERLFYEMGMDLPGQKQDPIFETDFGKFATFICFDIMWHKMAITSRLEDIDAVLYSSMWVDMFPYFMSISFFQAWAIGNNATLLAANLQMPGYLSVGSGIFRGNEGAIASSFNADGIAKLTIAAIPKKNRRNLPPSRTFAITENNTRLWQNEDDGKDVPEICSYSVLGKAKNFFKDYRCLNEDFSNYTLRRLDKVSDLVEVCNNGACCELNYTANGMNESFYLGVFSGFRNFFHRYHWSEQSCFLARCDDFNGTACSHFPTKAETLFTKIYMTANFRSKNVYPSLVSSSMRLVPTKKWTHDTKYNKPFIKFDDDSGIQLLVASLHSRLYNKDPPYIR